MCVSPTSPEYYSDEEFNITKSDNQGSFERLLRLLKMRDWNSIHSLLDEPSSGIFSFHCNFVALCRIRGSFESGAMQKFIRVLREQGGDKAVRNTINSAIDTMGNTPISAIIHCIADNASFDSETKSCTKNDLTASNLEGLEKLQWLLKLGALPAKMLNPVFEKKSVCTLINLTPLDFN